MRTQKRNRTARTRYGAYVIIGIVSLLLACATTKVDMERSLTHANTGLAYLQAGDPTSALKEFMTAEKYNPDDPTVHYYLGISYYVKGIKKEAVREFSKALALKADYSEAHNYLGTLYLESGDYDAAIAQFNEALTNMLYATPALAINNIGWAYYKKGDVASALAAFHRALEQEPDPVVLPLIYHNMGLVYLDENRIDDAMLHFKKALANAPAMVESRLRLGVCYMKKGDPVNAAREFRKVIDAAPDSNAAVTASLYLQMLLEPAKQN